MSLRLLKQSLDILEQDSAPKAPTNTKNKDKQSRQVIFTRATNSKRSESKSKTKKIGDIKNEIKQNAQKSNENLRKLLALSKNTLKNVDAEKIVNRAHKGRYVKMDLRKPKQEVESIFTDEDFRAFEEEYFKS